MTLTVEAAEHPSTIQAEAVHRPYDFVFILTGKIAALPMQWYTTGADGRTNNTSGRHFQFLARRF